MTERWARVARGWTTAGFATFAAALSHTLGGGAAPGALPVVLSLAFAGIVCIGLASRSASLWRVAASVLLSQLIFHSLFSLGSAGGALRTDAVGAPVVAHAHAAGTDLLSAGQSLGSPLPGMPGMPGMPNPLGSGTLDAAMMWLAHLAAAVVTIAALRHGERALRGLLGGARLVVRGLRPPTALPVRPRAPHRARAAVLVFRPRDLGVLLAARPRRGPPPSPRSA